MIRNDTERRNAEKQLDYLRAELEAREGENRDAATRDVAEALRMQITDIEKEVIEYDDLRNGRLAALEAETLDGLGDLLVKSRIARGWTQAALAEALDMEPQQVQRYERNDWQKASLWRLQEAAEALALDLTLRVRLAEGEALAREADSALEVGSDDFEITPTFLWQRMVREAQEAASQAQDMEGAYVKNAVHVGSVRATHVKPPEMRGGRRFVHDEDRELEAV